MNIYKESQRMFDSTFNKIIIVLVVVLLGKITYNAFQDEFTFATGISIAILILCILLFVVFRVNTAISQENIHIRISPFNVYNKTIYWNEIRKVEVVTYSALKEYGGWGYRVRKNGKAINPSGNKGLKIHFKDGSHLLVGTRKAEEMQEFLKSIKR